MPNYRNCLRFLHLATVIILLAACGGGGAQPENVYIADAADDGQTVTMAVGDVLQVMLSENPTTGYVWAIVTNDDAVLRLSDEPAYEAESDALGAGGTRTFLFNAVGAGTSVLRLVNARQQATAVEPAATFEITVQVSDL